MWNFAIEIFRHTRKAKRKHPSFPTRIMNAKTTRRAVALKCAYWKSLNDSGKETVNSVLQEEVCELMDSMYSGRWKLALSELYDVIAVLLRIRKDIIKTIKARNRMAKIYEEEREKIK